MKGNMLLGHARGSVGDVVFTRYDGQQIGYSRNRKPFNPKSEDQCKQRSLFVDQVKFYSQGVQNLFKFAFENKKQKESDFNAFMRLNKNYGVMITRGAYYMPTYPALGAWVMSQGSLPSPGFHMETVMQEHHYDLLYADIGHDNPETIGEISKAIMDYYKLHKGDIVTFVQILARGSTNLNTPMTSPQDRGNIEWLIDSFKIDPDSTQFYWETLKSVVIDFSQTYARINGYDNECIAGLAVIFSRPTRKKLLASNSRLILNNQAKLANAAAQDYQYMQDVIADWQATPNTILQGSEVVDPLAEELDLIKLAYGCAPSKTEAQKTGYVRPNHHLQKGYVPGYTNYVILVIQKYDFDQLSEFTLEGGDVSFDFVEEGTNDYYFKFTPPANATDLYYICYKGRRIFTIHKQP